MALTETTLELLVHLIKTCDDQGMARPSMASLENAGFGRRDIVRGILYLCQAGAIEPIAGEGYQIKGVEALVEALIDYECKGDS